jgi:hypothetical protein
MMYEAKAFLSTHRAFAVCTREFARLTEAVVAGAKAFARDNLDGSPVIRQAPDRCIVQLGPVALTIAWLRNGSDTPADGSLMVIVWRGVIAPRGDHSPERLGMRRVPPTPVSVWEETLIPLAESEATWVWRSESPGQDEMASPALAARCVEQLKLAHEAFTSEATDELTRVSGASK